VKLARRTTGGGAVYHDTGNLNYSVITDLTAGAIELEYAALRRAFAALGLPVEYSGRNDATIGGRKFSGAAYAQAGSRRLHHGTVMVNVDVGRMESLLTPPAAKLASNAVASVRSRVCNLREFLPNLQIGEVQDALLAAFAAECGVEAEPLPYDAEHPEVKALAEKYASEEWIFGKTIRFTRRAQGRYPWGGVTVELAERGGVIVEAHLYSDAMDADAIAAAQAALTGAPATAAGLRAALGGEGVAGDIAGLAAGMLNAEC